MRPMWSSGSFSSPRRATRARAIHARSSSVDAPNTTHSRSVYTDPHGGAGLGAGPTNRRRYSHTRPSSPAPRARPATMSPSASRASPSSAKGHSAAAGRGVERGHRLEGRPRVPGQGVLQEERGERVAREGDGVEHRVCLLVHAIVPFARFDETRLIKQKRIVHCSAPRLSAALRARYERAAYGKCQRRQSTPLKRVAAIALSRQTPDGAVRDTRPFAAILHRFAFDNLHAVAASASHPNSTVQHGRCASRRLDVASLVPASHDAASLIPTPRDAASRIYRIARRRFAYPCIARCRFAYHRIARRRFAYPCIARCRFAYHRTARRRGNDFGIFPAYITVTSFCRRQGSQVGKN